VLLATFNALVKSAFQQVKGFLLPIVGCLLAGAFMGVVATKGGPLMPFLFLALPFVFWYLYKLFYDLSIGLYTILILGFIIPFFGRYTPAIPFGLVVDILLILMWLMYFFREWQNVNLKPAKNGLTNAWGLWMLWVFLMIANPLSRSVEAWFYAMRGIALYSFLITPLIFINMRDKKHLHNVIMATLIFEVFGSFWGMKQLFIGVSKTEQAWLDAGAYTTHILFGKLRVFSYFTDAAQFGASQAHMGFVYMVFALAEKESTKRKIIYLLGGLISLYGMIISGSRGPLVIPALAGLVMLFMSKKFKLLITGLSIGAVLFVFLKYTTIMNSNYQVNRMRTALNPTDDPSFLVRKNREVALKAFLADKPIGGGIGSAGFWGKRFYPGTFLAEIGTDGHYTRIYMETGFIGLWIYLAVFIYMGIAISIRAWRIKDESLRLQIAALVGGYWGMALASYTNGLIVQLPTGPIIYISLCFAFMAHQWDTPTAELPALKKSA
jgi:cell division protein FtsW (lipid II flippase)